MQRKPEWDGRTPSSSSRSQPFSAASQSPSPGDVHSYLRVRDFPEGSRWLLRSATDATHVCERWNHHQPAPIPCGHHFDALVVPAPTGRAILTHLQHPGTPTGPVLYYANALHPTHSEIAFLTTPGLTRHLPHARSTGDSIRCTAPHAPPTPHYGWLIPPDGTGRLYPHTALLHAHTHTHTQ